MVVRGRGRVLVGNRLIEAHLHDLVLVPPRTWHQFRAGDDEPLGFVCVVDCERNVPERPPAADLAALRRNPAVAAFIRV